MLLYICKGGGNLSDIYGIIIIMLPTSLLLTQSQTKLNF